MLTEAAFVFSKLVAQGVRTIAFAKSRKSAELIYRYAADRLGPNLARRVSPYRAGYTVRERREIEGRLFSGELLGVVSTNALELGVDVGALDAVVCCGYPGSVASIWQQWGRAGRGKDPSLAVYIAGRDSLDQYLYENPEKVLGRRVEAARLTLENPYVLGPHLLAAAHESPLDAADDRYFGFGFDRVTEDLAEEGQLVRSGGGSTTPGGQPGVEDLPEVRGRGVRPCGGSGGGGDRLGRVAPRPDGAPPRRDLPAPGPRLRGRGPEPPRPQRPRQARPEPLLHQGTGRDGRGYPRRDAEEGSGQRREAPLGPRAHHRRRHPVQEDPGPGRTRDRRLPPRPAADGLRDARALGHPAPDAADTAADSWGGGPSELRGVSRRPARRGARDDRPAPPLRDVRPGDIGGLSVAVHRATRLPTIFVYDGYPGGVGISERGYETFEELARDTLSVLARCPCKRGCPACVQSPKCGNWNEPLSKDGAIRVLRFLLGQVSRYPIA
nr:Zn-binding domain-containing protein [Rubrobacter marinus]